MVTAFLEGAQEKRFFLCDQYLFLNDITQREYKW